MSKETKTIHLDLATVKGYVKKYQKKHSPFGGCPDYRSAIVEIFRDEEKRVIEIVSCGGKEGFDVTYVEREPVIYLCQYMEELAKQLKI